MLMSSKSLKASQSQSHPIVLDSEGGVRSQQCVFCLFGFFVDVALINYFFIFGCIGAQLWNEGYFVDSLGLLSGLGMWVL